ncbi:DUF4350 domain-containing protein [Flexivirga caeni]|uniref:DUF4350 domain-containing protein n=1 Tax=Flexivirga caeni TaxID=2294115 RepID=A0A3M9M9B4_9MICO|nr:DUF4350 domain-containing protein [Flexivirga caeni]RNI22161.1 DUF4350 domain-containing protein [Flexivirga caeni]
MITRSRVVLTAIGGVLVLILVGVVLLAPRTTDQPLDPDSAQGDGTRAVAQVLDQHGVHVSVVRRAAGLRGVAGATVVLTRPELLSAASLRRTMAAAAGARRLVIVDADPQVVDALQLPVSGLEPVDSKPDPYCTVPWLTGLRLTFADISYTPEEGATCFGEGGSGAIAVLPASDQTPETVLLGSRAALTNKTITSADNAAIALRILGSADRVVWLAPTLATADNPHTQGAKWPAWFRPGVWLAGAVVLVVMLWRGRRFGRLAVEPLPVVVPSDETTRSRGQLYRKARDRSRALAVLRMATRARLARYLGLAANAPPDELVARTSQAAGSDPRHTAELLYGTDPPDEASMVTLAQDLHQLERQVRR